MRGGHGGRRAGAERRRLRRQGGHVGPGADGAARAGHGPAGQAGAHARGVDPPPPQAPPDHACDYTRRLRRRGPAHRGEGAACSATRAPTPRSAARCSSARRGTPAGPYRVPHVDVEARRRLHQQPALRRDARLRRQPGCVRHRGLPGPAGGEGGPRRAGRSAARNVARGRRRASPPARCSRSRSASAGRSTRSRPPTTRRSAPGKAVGIACGIKNSGIGNGVAEWGKCRLVVERGRHGLALQRLHRDGPGAAHRAHAVRGRGDRPARRRSSDPKVDSTFALGCGQTTGSRATLFGGRAVASAAAQAPGRSRRGRDASRDLAGRVYAADVVIDDTTALGAAGPARQDPHRLRLRDAGRASSTRRDASSAWSRRTTWAAP